MSCVPPLALLERRRCREIVIDSKFGFLDVLGCLKHNTLKRCKRAGRTFVFIADATSRTELLDLEEEGRGCENSVLGEASSAVCSMLPLSFHSFWHTSLRESMYRACSMPSWSKLLAVDCHPIFLFMPIVSTCAQPRVPLEPPRFREVSHGSASHPLPFDALSVSWSSPVD